MNCLKKSFYILSIIFLCSCASQWKNQHTNEIRDSYPKFQECKKEVPEQKFDASCYTFCMDDLYRIGKKDYLSSAFCTEQCTKNTGYNTMVDDYDCNITRAKKEGWIRM